MRSSSLAMFKTDTMLTGTVVESRGRQISLTQNIIGNLFPRSKRHVRIIAANVYVIWAQRKRFYATCLLVVFATSSNLPSTSSHSECPTTQEGEFCGCLLETI